MERDAAITRNYADKRATCPIPGAWRLRSPSGLPLPRVSSGRWTPSETHRFPASPRLRETRLTPGRIANRNREWERPICAEGDGSRRRGDKTRRGEWVRAIDFLLGFPSSLPVFLSSRNCIARDRRSERGTASHGIE